MKLNGPSRECLRALWPDSRQQKLAYSIRPFKNLLSQGLVTVATLSGFFFSDCHKAVWWNQLGLLESACGPCDQIVDNRRWLIQSGLIKLLSQGLVTAATLSGYLNDCTTRPCDGGNYRAFSTILTSSCDENKLALFRVSPGLVTRMVLQRNLP